MISGEVKEPAFGKHGLQSGWLSVGVGWDI